MKTTIRLATPQDWEAVQRLLVEAELPLDGAHDHLQNFLLALDNSGVIACAGLEYYEDAALLRSVAVRPGHRGHGIGKALVAELLAKAAQRNIGNVALLTTTAVGYFPRMGFTAVSRSSLPEGVMASEEFKGACPDTATTMMLRLVASG